MGKIKGIAAGIEELLSLPITEAAISVTIKKLNSFINSAKKLDASPADIKKLEKIKKRKLRPSVGKPKPEGGSAKVAELRQIDDVGILYKGKTGSAAAKAYRKTPEARYEMLDAIKDEAKELGLSPSDTADIIRSASKYWQQLRRTAFPENVSPEDFLKSRMTPKELLQNRLAELKKQRLAGAKFKKPEVPKGKTKAESFASRKEPDPKKPTMQKGGAYKGKKHSYAAGGKVNKLNF